MSKGYDPVFDSDFVGYNCRDPEASGDFGVIEDVGDYAEEYYPSILESLPNEIKDRAIKENLMDQPDRNSDDFKLWSKSVCSFFKKAGIRWIFVREEIPQNDYDSQFYYVSIPEEKILCSFDYLFDDEEIRIIVYSSKGADKYRPKMFPVPDEFEDDSGEDQSESYDEDSYEEVCDGESYWEDAWRGR